MSKSGYIPIGALRMYYEVHGKGEPLVLLHGGGSGIDATFGRIIEQLAKTRQVIGLEQQGHGHTGDIDRPFSLEQMADDTDEALAQLNISKADIFGFSNGGQVALYLAIKHPEKVRKLILASTFYKPEGVIRQLREAWTKPAQVKDMPRGLVDAYTRVAPNPQDLQAHIDKSQQMMSTFTGISSKKVAQLGMPTLIIDGDRDVVRVEHALEMMNLIHDSRLVVLPGAHGAYMGELSTGPATTALPRITVELINEFLSGLEF